MGLLAFVLLPCLAQGAVPAPQDPTPQAVAGAQEPAPASTDALRIAEADDGKADADALAALALGPDGKLAARAAWLLARGKQPKRLPQLQHVVGHSAHVEARRQAMAGLLRCRENGSLPIALHALGDADRTVRTQAAQLLGALRRPSSREPLLALLHARHPAADGPATDAQAALLALLDLGAHDAMLRAATAVHDNELRGVGNTLAYCLQESLPKLARDQQLTLALGLLDHRETMVRRFAISHLAELAEPSTVKALEGRLAEEGHELRPLLEVALAHIRKDGHGLDDAAADPEASQLARAAARWDALAPWARCAWIAVPVALLSAVMLLWLRRRHVDAAALAAEPPLDDDIAADGEPTQALADDELFDDATDPHGATDGETDATDTTNDDAAAESVDDATFAPADAAFADESPTLETPDEQDLDAEPAFAATSTELEIVPDETTSDGDDAAR